PLTEVVFFFQAEDGIRDRNVTGVQTCALPICSANIEFTGRIWRSALAIARLRIAGGRRRCEARECPAETCVIRYCAWSRRCHHRSEERRVGKEGRERGWREH